MKKHDDGFGRCTFCHMGPVSRGEDQHSEGGVWSDEYDDGYELKLMYTRSECDGPDGEYYLELNYDGEDLGIRRGISIIDNQKGQVLAAGDIEVSFNPRNFDLPFFHGLKYCPFCGRELPPMGEPIELIYAEMLNDKLGPGYDVKYDHDKSGFTDLYFEDVFYMRVRNDDIDRCAKPEDFSYKGNR